MSKIIIQGEARYKIKKKGDTWHIFHSPKPIATRICATLFGSGLWASVGRFTTKDTAKLKLKLLLEQRK